MSYLKSFQSQILNNDYPAYLRLWEEFCGSDEVDPDELKKILLGVKESSFAASFGKHVEKIIPLCELLPEGPKKHLVFKLIFDIQTANNEELRAYAMNYLIKMFGEEADFAEKIRLIGLRGKDSFQGAISKFELLNHMKKGNFVFHTGELGVGEIIDISMIRNQISVEFEKGLGQKDVSFENAFHTLVPIFKDHFLALRFGDPDALERQAKENPLMVIRSLLRDLGPKTATEIKEELCDLVIPGKDWVRWWQNARAKIKKDTIIDAPEDLKRPFALRETELSHAERLRVLLEKNLEVNEVILAIYSFVRDFAETLKNQEVREFLKQSIQKICEQPNLTEAQKLQLNFFLEDLMNDKEWTASKEIVSQSKDLFSILKEITVLVYKKRLLILVKMVCNNWRELFLEFFFKSDQNFIRDYIFSEFLESETIADFKQKLKKLILAPYEYPEVFVWYFQKAINDQEGFLDDKAEQLGLFEAFFILLSFIEQSSDHRELVKKMHSILVGERYLLVRNMMQGSSIDRIQEVLLLASKCHSLSEHDLKIFHSLAKVACPSLKQTKKTADNDDNIIWTTTEGLAKVKKRIDEIIIESRQNTKEIEIARSYGDMRENTEFKAAKEKRDRLQSELRTLSDMVNRARVLTAMDILKGEVGVGSVVECKNSGGSVLEYTLLGPWDVDIDCGILSFQSRIAQGLMGKTVGSTFQFQGEEYAIISIRGYFD
jgi:transcription elongation factor GreA-like protein/transcription elongation GreA/GreB family factor